MRYIELSIQFSNIAVTVAARGHILCCLLKCRNDILKITHISEVVKLAESHKHVQTVFFVKSLQESTIHVSQLFRDSSGLLPVQIGWCRCCCHLVKPDKLLILEPLHVDINIEGAIQCEGLDIVAVRIEYLFVCCVSLTEASRTILIEHTCSSVGLDVEPIPSTLTYFFDVVAMYQLCRWLLQTDLEVTVDRIEHAADSYD